MEFHSMHISQRQPSVWSASLAIAAFWSRWKCLENGVCISLQRSWRFCVALDWVRPSFSTYFAMWKPNSLNFCVNSLLVGVYGFVFFPLNWSSFKREDNASFPNYDYIRGVVGNYGYLAVALLFAMQFFSNLGLTAIPSIIHGEVFSMKWVSSLRNQVYQFSVSLSHISKCFQNSVQLKYVDYVHFCAGSHWQFDTDLQHLLLRHTWTLKGGFRCRVLFYFMEQSVWLGMWYFY